MKARLVAALTSRWMTAVMFVVAALAVLRFYEPPETLLQSRFGTPGLPVVPPATPSAAAFGLSGSRTFAAEKGPGAEKDRSRKGSLFTAPLTVRGIKCSWNLFSAPRSH